MNFNVYARHPETGLLTTYQIPEGDFAGWLTDMQDAGYVCGIMSVTAAHTTNGAWCQCPYCKDPLESPAERLVRISGSTAIHWATGEGSYVRLACTGRNVRSSRLAAVGTPDVVTCRSCLGGAK